MLKDLYEIKNIEDINKIISAIDDINIMSQDTTYLLNERILLKNTLYTAVSNQVKKITSKSYDLNLSHLFEKHIYSSRRIKLVLDKFPNVNRNLGCVPNIFLERVNNKQECAKKLFDILAKYSFILNFDYEEMGNENCCTGNCRALEQELAQLTKKDIKIEYVGHGVNGNGYKITVDDKNYFYKVFYPHNEFHDSNINYLHGGAIEPAFGIFVNKNAAKNRFVKFYMGRIATKYDRDAFMVTDFLESDYTRPEEKLKIDYIQMKESEVRRFDNFREGKIVDFGGMILNKNEKLQNPQIRKLVRVILNHISYKHNEFKISYTWSINQVNLKSLKKFIKKYDKNVFEKALEVIEAHGIVSDTILKFLYSINEAEEGIVCTKILKVKDIFSTDLDHIRKKIEEYSVVCATESKPTTEQFDGYIMLDILNDFLCIIFYDLHNKVKSVRLVKKIGQQFETIIEVKSDKIDSFAEETPFYKLYSDYL